MVTGQSLEGMGEEEILAFADVCAETARRAEVDLLRAAYQWAVVHDPDRLDPAQAGRPGRERARRLGGEGVGEVTEFAAAEFGARIGRSPYAAARLIADAQDLRHRHPVLWGRVEAGEVRASYARFVTGRTRELSRSEAGHVDATVAESADGRISWSRFEALVEAQVVAAAPAVAKAREEKARLARFAKKLRGPAEGPGHGMASFMVRADVATIEQIDAAVTALAARLKQTMPEASEDERRVRAVLILCHPGATPHTDIADLLPTILLFVHLYGGTAGAAEHASPETGADTGADTGPDRDTGPVVRVEGHGPVTASWVRDVLGTQCRFRITPVIDLNLQAPVDAYEIPDRHRRAVHLMTPADIFPFASSLSRRKQVDHTIPHHQGGASGVGNYGPMTTRHHRIKTHSGWQVKQPFPGIYLWRDPHGGYYLIDHTGTRRLRRTTTREQKTQPRAKPVVVEIWRNNIQIDYHAA